MTASHIHVGMERIVTKLVAAVLQVFQHFSFFFFSPVLHKEVEAIFPS